MVNDDGYPGDYSEWDDDGTLEGVRFESVPRLPVRVARRVRAQVTDWRSQWQPNVTVAAIVNAHRNIMDDEPRLRNLIDTDLMTQVRALYPLRWRYDDLRWHLRQARVAVTGGRPELTAPWREEVAVEMSQQNRAFFERNVIVIRAEAYRTPRGVYLWGPRVITDRWLAAKSLVRRLRAA